MRQIEYNDTVNRILIDYNCNDTVYNDSCELSRIFYLDNQGRIYKDSNIVPFFDSRIQGRLHPVLRAVQDGELFGGGLFNKAEQLNASFYRERFPLDQVLRLFG